jgi:DNA-binding HxlR family transcriptional regulator
MPVVVKYELTEYSETLQDVIRALSEWGAMHRQIKVRFQQWKSRMSRL